MQPFLEALDSDPLSADYQRCFDDISPFRFAAPWPGDSAIILAQSIDCLPANGRYPNWEFEDGPRR